MRKKEFFILTLSANFFKFAKAKWMINGPKLVSVPLKIPLELSDEEKIKKEEGILAEKIISLSKKEKLPLLIGLPEEFVFSKVLIFEKSKNEIAKELRESIEKIFPVKKEEVYFDFEILGNVGEAGLLASPPGGPADEAGKTVQVIAAERSIIDLLSDLITKIKLPLLAFEPVSFSLARLSKEIKTPHLILFFENGFAVSVIAKGGAALYSASKPLKENLKPEELHTFLIGEVLVKAQDFVKSKGSEAIKKIFLYGDNAEELKTWFLEKFKNEFEIIAPFKKEESVFADLIGLSQKGLPSLETYEDIIDILPPNQVEFLNNEEKRKRKAVLNTILRIFFVVAITSLGLGNFYLFTLLNQHKSALKDVKNAAILEKRQELIKKVNNLNKLLGLGESLFSKRIFYSRFKEEFLTYSASGIKLLSLKFDFENKDGEIVGFSKTREDFSEFVGKLEKSDFIESVNFPLSLFDKKADFDFVIVLKIKMDKFFNFSNAN